MAQAEVVEGEPIKKHHFFLMIFILFLIVFFYLIYSSYNGGIGIKDKITGKVLKDRVLKENKNMTMHIISGELNIPEELIISSKIEKLQISIKDSTFIFLGDQKIELKKDSIIVIDEFKGKLVLIGDKIAVMIGKAKEILINTVPISKKSGTEIKIKNDQEFIYKNIMLKEVYISSYSHPSKGDIFIDEEKIILNLDNENLDVKGFIGDLEISQGKLKINGKFEKFDLNEILKGKTLNKTNK